MLAFIQKFVLSALVLLLSFTTACGESATAPVDVPDSVTITAPQYGMVDAYLNFPVAFTVWVCSSGASTPQIVAEIPNQVSTSATQVSNAVTTRTPVASVVGVNTELSLTHCSDGRSQYITFVQIQGRQIGVTQGVLFLKDDPRVRITFMVNVRHDGGQKG